MKNPVYFYAIVLLLASTSFSASKFQASSVENLQRATATEIGNDTRTADVTIINIKRKATSVTWYARAKDTCYECDADDMVRKVHIVKIDCSLVPAADEKKKKK